MVQIYYLHNWEYGSIRNDSRRIHNSQILFSKLSEEEKLKDVESIKSRLRSRQSCDMENQIRNKRYSYYNKGEVIKWR